LRGKSKTYQKTFGFAGTHKQVSCAGCLSLVGALLRLVDGSVLKSTRARTIKLSNSLHAAPSAAGVAASKPLPVNRIRHRKICVKFARKQLTDNYPAVILPIPLEAGLL